MKIEIKAQIDNNMGAESTISNPVVEIKMLSYQLEVARKEAEQYQKLKSTFISQIVNSSYQQSKIN